MTIALKLTHDEPRLVYLALTYHLGRPGSELDPQTKRPVEGGLAAVQAELSGALEAEAAVIELDQRGYERLLSAIKGSMTELRVQHMRGGAASTVAAFSETARALFPQLGSDPGFALDLTEAMMMLHRRLERAVQRAAAGDGSGEPGAGKQGGGTGSRKPGRFGRNRR